MIIETSSRLHFGIIDMSREFIYQYGALGLMIKGGFKIEINPVDEGFTVEADPDVVNEINKICKKLKKHYELNDGYHIKVLRKVPRHIGLGSTTQLHMGVSSGILKLAGHDVSLKEIAGVVGRSRYSAIGTYGFKYGGFILEGGKVLSEEIPPLLTRMDVPEHWRFVIVSPKNVEAYDEDEERPIMDEMKVDMEFPQNICHHIVMGILPSLKSKDIEDFGFHLSKLQRLVGESFEPFQGGVFHPAISEVIAELDKVTHGAGQSSWGPTAYGLIEAEKADKIKKHMVKWLNNKNIDAYVLIAEPSNHGAMIRT